MPGINIELDLIEIEEILILDDDLEGQFAPEVLYAPVPDPEAEDLIGEFVELFNARDMDELSELLAVEVDSDLVHGTGRDMVIEGLEEIFIRQPAVVLTRGELGSEPLAAFWHPTPRGYVCVGYLLFETTGGPVERLSRLEYVDEIDDESLCVEVPDRAEIDDWEILDEEDTALAV